MTFRVPNSNFFVGANYKYMAFDTEFDLGIDLPEWFPPLETTFKSGGVGILAEYDSRNTIFTTDRGLYIHTDTIFYRDAFGSDRDFNRGRFNARGWTPLNRSLVLGLRADANFSSDNVPFYMQPTIDLRGISLDRYQGAHTAVAEAELRWDVTPRWSLVFFGGSGWVAEDDLSDFDFSDGKWAGGTGFRYNIAKVFGIRMGLDFAWSEDGFNFYVTTGTAWGQK